MKTFQYQVEQFADLRILRYQVPGFSELSLQKKLYIYYLSEACLCGRDIIWDQNGERNLWLRNSLELLLQATQKNNSGPKELEEFYKRVLFSNGLHHHYSTDKLKPGFDQEMLKKWVSLLSSHEVKILGYETEEQLMDELNSLLFDESYLAKRVCQEEGKDLVIESANNFYKGLNQKEAETFYANQLNKDDDKPISYGLNSRLIKDAQGVREEKWCVGGKYSIAIEKIVYWLKRAASVAENKQQKKVIDLLCAFYQTGNLAGFDDYSIEWLKEQTGEVDFINGFIEVYGDPLGFKATWESLVNIIDPSETKKAKLISDHAQWFEDHSPVMPAHRKEKVNGVSMKVINAIMLGGDCYPASPLGINLPNSEWIRELHGSKSVSLQNISKAYEMASLASGVIEEFAADDEELNLHKQYGALADNLHTHLHECVGHGSGKLEKGVRSDALKAYASVIEEARADLFGLYFIADEKMIDLSLADNFNLAKTQYNSYIRNGLMVQLARIQKGANIEQTHMRNRQIISGWALEMGAANNVIEKLTIDEKTYFKVNDYNALRDIFGHQLKEVQRIKSQGDYEAAKLLVEKYGVKVDAAIYDEVLERYSRLNVAPYSGFINPKLSLIYNDNNDVVDVSIDYSEGFMEQMQRYNQMYGFENREAVQ